MADDTQNGAPALPDWDALRERLQAAEAMLALASRVVDELEIKQHECQERIEVLLATFVEERRTLDSLRPEIARARENRADILRDYEERFQRHGGPAAAMHNRRRSRSPNSTGEDMS